MKSKVSVKYSNNYYSKVKRIKTLDKKTERLFKAPLKRDALLTVKNFKDGIRKNSFGLKKLADGTIIRKRLLGMERPETPLYGKGEDKKRNSYVNMLRIKNEPDGVIVYPSQGMHWSKKISLFRLWKVHELGTAIKRGKGIIRIPARPALLMAFRKTMGMRNVRRDAKFMQRAMTDYINTGNKTFIIKAEEGFLKGLKQYETRDR